jgi:hypothetical protein
MAHGSSRIPFARLLWMQGCCWAAMLCFAPAVRAEASSHRDLKAAILYNFAHFVDWPESAFSSAVAPFVIGIIGQDPFGPNLDALAKREKKGDHQLVIERYESVEAIGPCHILFVSSSEQARLAEILAHLEKRPVLTVAEYDGFIGGGGLVWMNDIVGERIQIQVNLKAIQSRGLLLSAKLLRVVEVVSTDED